LFKAVVLVLDDTVFLSGNSFQQKISETESSVIYFNTEAAYRIVFDKEDIDFPQG
jgi:hypothetical protein